MQLSRSLILEVHLVPHGRAIHTARPGHTYWHIPAVATAAKDGRSRLERGRWPAARWLPEREQRIAELEQEIDQSADRGSDCRRHRCATRARMSGMGRCWA